MFNCNCKKAPQTFPQIWGEVEKPIMAAVSKLLKNDSFLLEIGASERSVSHRLGMYLQDNFTEWNVDCEYNRVRNKGASKIQPREELCETMKNIQNAEILPELFSLQDHEKARKELAVDSYCNPTAVSTTRRCFPDVIIHKRGCEIHNLLVLEMKPSTADHDKWKVLIDWAKLLTFTQSLDGHADSPRYQFGIFLEFDKSSLSSAWRFERGQPIAMQQWVTDTIAMSKGERIG